MSLDFDWKYETRCNKLSFWKSCKKSTSLIVSSLLTDMPLSPLQSALYYIHISMDETVPGTILWHNYFTIFQFKVSWRLCCSPPEWGFPIIELRKWCSFWALWDAVGRHTGALTGQDICWDPHGALCCGWSDISVFLSRLRNSSWQVNSVNHA